MGAFCVTLDHVPVYELYISFLLCTGVSDNINSVNLAHQLLQTEVAQGIRTSGRYIQAGALQARVPSNF